MYLSETARVHLMDTPSFRSSRIFTPMSPAARAAAVFRTWNRRRKSVWLGHAARERDVRTVLLVGAGGNDEPWENLVERSVADGRFAVWCGIDERSNLANYVRCDGRALPFRDASFDLALSNAVIEHVGDEADQRRFVAEHARVGRYWAVTTPNRWYPIESHTMTVVRHWSRRWRDQRSEFTRLLSRRDLRRLAPSDSSIVGSLLAPTFISHGPGTSPSASPHVHPGQGAVHPRTVDSPVPLASNRFRDRPRDRRRDLQPTAQPARLAASDE